MPSLEQRYNQPCGMMPTIGLAKQAGHVVPTEVRESALQEERRERGWQRPGLVAAPRWSLTRR